MNKLKDLNTNGNGIMTNIFKVSYPEEYVQLFGDDNAELLDAYINMQYGEKPLLPAINGDNWRTAVNGVIMLFLDNWIKQSKAVNAEYNPLQPVTGNTSHTETLTADENGESVTSERAFNDSAPIETESGVNGKTRTDTRTTETTTSGTAGKTAQQLVDAELRLRRANFKKSVIFTLVSDLTLSIYSF